MKIVEHKILIFSAEFNCSDGTVLEMDQVCDGKDDCRKFYGHHAEDEEPRLCAGPGEDV